MNSVNFFALNLPPDKAEVAEQDILAALDAAVDLSNQPIVATAVNGFNAAILDAMLTTPNPELCPYIGINTWVSRGTDAQGGKEVFRSYMLSMYFIYYYGNPATDPSYWSMDAQFTALRDRHIAACMQAIEMQSGGNATATIPASHGWKWATELQPSYDYFSPFRFIGETYKLPPGYNCVRVDRPIRVYFTLR